MTIAPLPVAVHVDETQRYARAITASKRARWDLESDVLRGRALDRSQKFLPDALSLVHRLPFLTRRERVFFSQVQGRTYANLFALVERSVNAKVLELARGHLLGDQVALEALVRFSDEELKHQELFRRLEALAAQVMPDGYRFEPDANQVACVVLGKPTWSVLALILLIELVTQVHYKQAFAPDGELSALYKDVFRFHWMEESQHAVLDELEWLAEDRRLEAGARDEGVLGLIELVGAVDGMLQLQAGADATYLLAQLGRELGSAEQETVRETLLAAYRYQHILSGARETRFVEVLKALLEPAQFARIIGALAALT